MDNIEIGKVGESIACNYLIKHQHKIVEKNYSKPRWGEIDIITLDINNCLCFIEVKTRTNNRYGNPVDSISPVKLRSLSRSINYYLLTQGSKYIGMSMKLIVISIQFQKNTYVLDYYDFSDKISVNL